MKVYWPHHATSNFCPCSSFFGLPGSVLLPEMLCQTFILVPKRKPMADWTMLSRSSFSPCVQILLVLKKHRPTQWGNIITTCGSANTSSWWQFAGLLLQLSCSLPWSPQQKCEPESHAESYCADSTQVFLLWIWVSTPWCAGRLWWKALKTKKSLFQ